MIIESVELENFKSFGSRSRVFFKPGLTVISGPNGSGKSNIGDALVFVLGTRSSKIVRAEKMGDLIYRPKEGERAPRHCSVTLNLREEGTGETVSIKRELVEEDGEIKGNYYMNGKKARLSDIEAFLLRNKISLDSYSFVLQGDINNLIKMSGTERRRLIESIAGLDVIDMDIERSRRDRESVISNLNTLQAVSQEIETRVSVLRAEKELAERYIEMQGRLRQLRATYIHLEAQAIRAEIEALERTLRDNEERISRLENRLEEIQQEQDERRKRVAELSSEIEERYSAEIRRLQEELDRKRIQAAEIRMRIEDREGQYRELEEERKRGDQRLAALEGRLSELLRREGEMEKALVDLREKEKRAREELERLRALRSGELEEFQRMNRELEGLNAERERLQAEMEEMQKRLMADSARKSQTESAIAARQEDLADLEAELRDTDWRLKKMVPRSEEALRDLSAKYYRLRAEVEEMRQRKDRLARELSDLGREYERLVAQSQRGQSSRALQEVMEARRKGKIDGIFGTLRELISFEERYRAAVESAAGGRLNAVVVRDDGVAEECLGLLKQSGAGRLTFLPLNKMSTGRPRGKAIIVRNQPESLGYIFEIVRYERQFESAVWYAFQDTVLVPGVKEARKYMGGVRLVTLDGDIFEASGAITGGSQEKAAARLDVDARLQQVSQAIREKSEEMEALTADLSSKSAMLEDVSEELRKATGDVASSQGLKRELESRMASVSSKIEEARQRIRELEEERAAVERRIGTTREEMDSVRTRVSEVSSRIAELTAALRETSPEKFREMEAREEALRSLGERIREVLTELSGVKRDVEHTREEVERERENLEDTAIRLRDIERANTEARNRVSSIEEEIASIRASIATYGEGLKDLEAKREAEVRALESLAREYDRARAEVSSKRDVQSSLRGRISDLRAQLSSKEGELEASGGEPDVSLTDRNEVSRLMAETQRHLDSLGQVNMRALEEYEAENSRLSEMKGKMSALLEEKKAIEEFTERLLEQRKVTFLRVFDSIREEMRKVYQELSGGGDAILYFSNENDPMGSEVHIKARPKGTRYTRLEALSGGEKSLTALSFIIAVQRTFPSPFYFLDEVDMFLDGANVDRIGKLLRDASKNAQIIVISLRKAMLKYANSVIGVTVGPDERTHFFQKYIGEVVGS
ncbi:chromosome segregation protein SMC [Thermogymnomonas acidicola]|uniref:Chromosome partition protein Smc n=1 Tax=Thermogymnomonas acidicola TaxID=399579 RepID=A0AA37F9P4_9ARCH|nr:chromosome segregation protein SMC [Thermogymnomonas acidicola]GGM76113.1 chromosome segregation protein SMC [Thermogymnomonas acidicola]